MKIVFFGTPIFALESLKKIFASGHELAAVVTAPDKQRGRGRKVSFTPIKEFALSHRLGCLQPEDLNDPKFIEDLKLLKPDLFVVVAYRILPLTVYTIPAEGSINLHGSLLPKYRGAAPIQRAIMNGESKTGLTTFFLEEKVDTGNMILRREVEIDPDDNFGSLHDKMSIAGAELLIESIELIEKGNLIPAKQDNSSASKAPKIKKEDCLIDFSLTAFQIHNLVRGLSPYPGAYFSNEGKIYKVYRTQIIETDELKPGEILESKHDLIIGCGENGIRILEIQPEGRKKMTIDEFLRGYSLRSN